MLAAFTIEKLGNGERNDQRLRPGAGKSSVQLRTGKSTAGSDRAKEPTAVARTPGKPTSGGPSHCSEGARRDERGDGPALSAVGACGQKSGPRPARKGPVPPGPPSTEVHAAEVRVCQPRRPGQTMRAHYASAAGSHWSMVVARRSYNTELPAAQVALPAILMTSLGSPQHSPILHAALRAIEDLARGGLSSFLASVSDALPSAGVDHLHTPRPVAAAASQRRSLAMSVAERSRRSRDTTSSARVLKVQLRPIESPPAIRADLTHRRLVEHQLQRGRGNEAPLAERGKVVPGRATEQQPSSQYDRGHRRERKRRPGAGDPEPCVDEGTKPSTSSRCRRRDRRAARRLSRGSGMGASSTSS